MEYIIATWLAFGLMNAGVYSNQKGYKTKQEAFIFFLMGPVVSFIWLGIVASKRIGGE